MVRLRVRYFSVVYVLRSKKFVETIVAENLERFDSKRKNGARRISVRAQETHSMRRLRLRTIA
jgi:hypothetical protein